MKKLLVLSLLLAACGGGSTATETASTESTESTGSETPAFAMVSVDAVAAGIAPDATNRLAVFDANSRETFDAGHVPGATWVHYDSVTAEILPSDPAAPVVFYCANEGCGASHTAAETAVSLGHTNVAVMGAGIEGWRAAGQPVEAAAPAPVE